MPLALVDSEFAKEQLILLLREWYMHPNGQIPAYEWAFGDVNPPVHAWAAIRVFEIDGRRDHAFLARDVRQHLHARFAPTWIDAAELPKALFPSEAQVEKTLDDWLLHLSIEDIERHNALGDAYATAQFFIVMLAKARREGYWNARGLLRAQKNHHWQRKR